MVKCEGMSFLKRGSSICASSRTSPHRTNWYTLSLLNLFVAICCSTGSKHSIATPHIDKRDWNALHIILNVAYAEPVWHSIKDTADSKNLETVAALSHTFCRTWNDCKSPFSVLIGFKIAYTLYELWNISKTEYQRVYTSRVGNGLEAPVVHDCSPICLSALWKLEWIVVAIKFDSHTHAHISNSRTQQG